MKATTPLNTKKNNLIQPYNSCYYQVHMYKMSQLKLFFFKKKKKNLNYSKVV